MTRWTFRLDLPPNNNHQYIPVRGGGKVLTAAARQYRQDVQVRLPRDFRPTLEHCYSVMAWFTFPTAAWDIDGCIKALLDSCFGSRLDHKVIALHCWKKVDKARVGVTVRIAEV